MRYPPSPKIVDGKIVLDYDRYQVNEILVRILVDLNEIKKRLDKIESLLSSLQNTTNTSSSG